MTCPCESIVSMRNCFLFLQNNICADHTAQLCSLTSDSVVWCQETVVIAVFDIQKTNVHINQHNHRIFSVSLLFV